MRRSTELSVSSAVAAVLGFGRRCWQAAPDIYYDRRETVLFGADDAVASNKAVQTIDPWPPGSADRSAPGTGPRVAAAIARYRTGKVYPPQGNGTSSSYQQQQQQPQARVSRASRVSSQAPGPHPPVTASRRNSAGRDGFNRGLSAQASASPSGPAS